VEIGHLEESVETGRVPVAIERVEAERDDRAVFERREIDHVGDGADRRDLEHRPEDPIALGMIREAPARASATRRTPRVPVRPSSCLRRTEHGGRIGGHARAGRQVVVHMTTSTPPARAAVTAAWSRTPMSAVTISWTPSSTARRAASTLNPYPSWNRWGMW
jgi:hypothetical protein